MTVGKGKRPTDPSQLAKWIVEQSTADELKPKPTPTAPSISSYMAAMGRKGGKVGGKRRLLTMTPENRKEAAAKAARARWDKAKGLKEDGSR
jgi:hypothetical protein